MTRLLALSAALLTACAVLAACATTTVGKAVCLPLKPYSAADQAELAAEISALPPSAAMIVTAMGDYGAMRDADRACQAAPP